MLSNIKSLKNIQGTCIKLILLKWYCEISHLISVKKQSICQNIYSIWNRVFTAITNKYNYLMLFLSTALVEPSNGGDWFKFSTFFYENDMGITGTKTYCSLYYSTVCCTLDLFSIDLTIASKFGTSFQKIKCRNNGFHKRRLSENITSNYGTNCSTWKRRDVITVKWIYFTR